MNSLKSILLSATLLLIANISFAQTIDDAKKLTKSEQFSPAEDAFKKMISATPQTGDLYYFYGENEIKSFFSDTISNSLGDVYVKCKRIFENGSENETANQINNIGLARIEYLKGNKTKANEIIAAVKLTLPAMDLKIKKIQDPKRYALLLTELAKVYISPFKTDTASALILLNRAKQADPKNAEILITKGDAYLYTKDVNRAIENYNIAQTLDPQSPIAKHRIGYLYIRAKNLQAAIPYFEEALKIDPNFAPAYKELGYIYSLAKQFDKSKTNYTKYLELSGNNIPAKIIYIVTLFKSQDYKTCISQINEVFAVDSSINVLNRVIAFSYFEEKQNKKAIYYITKFFNNTANSPEKRITKDYVYYGKILGEFGKADLAEEQLRKAFSMDSTQLGLFVDIAGYQAKVKNYKKACAALEEKISIKPTVPDYYNLGKFYYQDSMFVQADKAFETLLNINDPAKVKAYEILTLYWQGYAKTGIDVNEEGIAKPVYEKLIEKSSIDSVKNKKYIIEGNLYLGYYYLSNKVGKDYVKSKKYYLDVIAIDPNNEMAKKALQTAELMKVKLPE